MYRNAGKGETEGLISVPVPEGVGEKDGVLVGVADEDGVLVGVDVPVALLLRDGVAVSDSQRAPPTPFTATVANVPPSSAMLWKPHGLLLTPNNSMLMLPGT